VSGVAGAALLVAWEAWHGRGPAEGALELLAAASPGTDREELAALPLGVRDRRLLALRAETLGPEVEAVADCPACGARVELVWRLPEAGPGRVPAPAREHRAARGGLELAFRLPDSTDLLAAADAPGEEPARRLLARRCLLSARRDGDPVAAGELTDGEIEALAGAIEAADPDAETVLALTCAACGHAWREPLDVAAFVLAELSAAAAALLAEVAALASRCGWSEREVLAMSPARRRAYLEMLA